jgi:hypothetical protein
MATPQIKNVNVLSSTFPSVNGSNEYVVRYRIVTEDRNRYSQWSPIFRVAGKPVSLISEDKVVSTVNGRAISIVWQDIQTRPIYDLFIKFDDGEYLYHGSTSTPSYSLISQGESNFRFLIQVGSIGKAISPSLSIFESEEISLVV